MSDYSKLGTPNKRKETKEDHRILSEMMRREWELVRDFPKKSYQDIKNWQLKRIRQLVSHAFETVPLYREKYSAVGFHPDDLKTWSDFESLPILEKKELIGAFPDKSISSSHRTEFTTRSSGSSGQFVTIAVSPQAVYKDTIQGARQLFSQSGGMVGPEDVTLFIYTGPWWVSSIDGKYKSEYITTTSPVQKAIEKIRDVRPKVLSLYPSYLKRLAEADADLKGNNIELIIVHSEQSAKRERDSLSKQFGIPVLDEFSSEELTRIALECPNRNYHLEEDACYVEIVNPDRPEESLGLSEEGLVVGTNLLNEATPIIRYHQGDIASIQETSYCGCGSNFRILSQPKGRKMDCVVTSKGDRIPSGSFMDLAYNWYLEMGIPIHGLRYQIIQEKEDEIDVYVVPGSYEFTEENSGMIRKSLYTLVPSYMSVNIHTVDHVPVETTKHRPVLSRCNK